MKKHTVPHNTKYKVIYWTELVNSDLFLFGETNNSLTFRKGNPKDFPWMKKL